MYTVESILLCASIKRIFFFWIFSQHHINIVIVSGESCTDGFCDNIRTDECYLNPTTCCETCAAPNTQVVGCEFGDLARICDLSLCDHHSNRQVCCDTCKDYTTQGVTTGDGTLNTDAMATENTAAPASTESATMTTDSSEDLYDTDTASTDVVSSESSPDEETMTTESTSDEENMTTESMPASASAQNTDMNFMSSEINQGFWSREGVRSDDLGTAQTVVSSKLTSSDSGLSTGVIIGVAVASVVVASVVALGATLGILKNAASSSLIGKQQVQVGPAQVDMSAKQVDTLVPVD